MKLIIAGATGFVGKELLSQGLCNPQVSSIIAISRGPVSAPDGANQFKLKSVVVKDYGTYTTGDRKEFTDAAACIWTVGVIPMKSPNMAFEEVRKICLDDTIGSLNVMVDSNPMKPFRFLYMSGADSERDQTKVPKFMPEYFLMRACAT
ncbi:hypothetical protein BU24DRAFT_359479 [Aaosphaeria arxii CBS 175.79]|uniref:NAD(P)-binding domain-containing protein n=1 Tax=Aaosphaeria arxii CBS 175.79 TaxID=1450172 RepID=A0A6A5X7H6_9PLEO|nr:uncharacterized protein BU24DRAFT_359479 [Aaosphaeria arxii CBS 175.79]KAF2008870.1 hypothetical protein BU24DRAFT_359479 [Aaosphaeria arxii CBS 175.79]